MKDDPFISWKDLKEFILHNGWNWNKFLSSKISVILNSFGYLASEALINLEFDLDDLDDFKLYLDSLEKSILVITYETIQEYMQWTENTSKNQLISPQEFIKKNQKLNKINSCFRMTTISEKISLRNLNIEENESNHNQISNEMYYLNRFQSLSKEIIKNWENLPNRPKMPNSLEEIEINERIFLIGLIAKSTQSTSHLHHIKIILINYLLHIHIYALLSVSKMPSNEFPLGLVIGITGKVTDISHGKNWNNVIHITTDSWFFPSINYLTSDTSNLPNNESWVAVFGTPDISKKHNSLPDYFNRLIHWINKNHSEFRLNYLIFTGGLMSSLEVLNLNDKTNFDLELDLDYISIKEYYNLFYKFLKNLSENIHIFIVPNISDITREQIPQPPIHRNFQTSSKNVHFLTNPAMINLEEKNILLYNPFQYFNFKYYLDDPERFVIDFLKYKHLYPKWPDTDPIFPTAEKDCLVIQNSLDIFICNHPSSTKYSAYKNINIGLISSLNKDNSTPVLVFNLHTRENFSLNVAI